MEQLCHNDMRNESPDGKTMHPSRLRRHSPQPATQTCNYKINKYYAYRKTFVFHYSWYENVPRCARVVAPFFVFVLTLFHLRHYTVGMTLGWYLLRQKNPHLVIYKASTAMVDPI